jgi:hypothetical protein
MHWESHELIDRWGGHISAKPAQPIGGGCTNHALASPMSLAIDLMSDISLRVWSIVLMVSVWYVWGMDDLV